MGHRQRSNRITYECRTRKFVLMHVQYALFRFDCDGVHKDRAGIQLNSWTFSARWPETILYRNEMKIQIDPLAKDDGRKCQCQ